MSMFGSYLYTQAQILSLFCLFGVRLSMLGCVRVKYTAVTD